jgi:hypothetical protein
MGMAQNKRVLLVHAFVFDWLARRAGRSQPLIIGGKLKLREIVFLLHDKDLGRARRDRLLHLLQEVQGRTFLKEFHDAIALALGKHLATGQDAGSTRNTSISHCNDFHLFFSLLHDCLF